MGTVFIDIRMSPSASASPAGDSLGASAVAGDRIAAVVLYAVTPGFGFDLTCQSDPAVEVKVDDSQVWGRCSVRGHE